MLVFYVFLHLSTLSWFIFSYLSKAHFCNMFFFVFKIWNVERSLFCAFFCETFEYRYFVPDDNHDYHQNLKANLNSKAVLDIEWYVWLGNVQEQPCSHVHLGKGIPELEKCSRGFFSKLAALYFLLTCFIPLPPYREKVVSATTWCSWPSIFPQFYPHNISWR